MKGLGDLVEKAITEIPSKDLVESKGLDKAVLINA
jgi:hypothetical protein